MINKNAREAGRDGVMAAETTGQATTDETAVRGLYQQLMDGWNQGSGAAFAAAFTDDGDLVAFDGTHLKGRAQIAAVQQRLFDKFLKGTRLVGSVEQVRFLGPETAVMHAVGNTVMRRKSTPAPNAPRSRPWSRSGGTTAGAWPPFRTPASARWAAARGRSWSGRLATGSGGRSA
jgi:uncharacterized protein (TIGR02246 family)